MVNLFFKRYLFHFLGDIYRENSMLMRVFIFAICLTPFFCCRDKAVANVSAVPIHEYVEIGWNYAFGIPKEIVLHRIGDSIWLQAKEIGKETNPLTREMRNYQLGPGGLTDTIFYYQKLSRNEWSHVDSLLDVANFWTLPQNINDKTIDGTYWKFKAHSRGKRHVISRCSPLETNLKAIALLMIRLAGYNDEIQ